jgi:hypothetical protein
MSVVVNINVPTDGSHVSGGGTFTTFGTVSPSGATMSAWVMDGSTRYDGSSYPPVPHNPPYNWGFRFTGIPTGHAVTLHVKGVSGSEEDEKTASITCDA